ncbi:MAG TPA: glycosyltransferase family 39 protein [Trebonia sp.]|nr:glycosyltransferase family 39 protein [Trebonia sp.]
MSATTVTFEPAHRASPPPGRLRRLMRGPATDPQWARPALFGLLALTSLLYLWDLSRNGYANDFYAAAVQAGTKSWKAAFFGSFDSSNFITVDKTPASLWVDELSAKIFGLNSWSLLAPQAVEGVASVALLYAAVRRWFGPPAGLIAGAVLALTPAAALIFRFNNPDALLVLLMTAAGYAVQRALERDRTRWLVLAGLLIGFAFLTKMAQAFLVLPGFGIAYLWAGPTRLGRRIWQLLAGLGGVIVGAGWWIAIAQLTPAADRPYFGGSTDNNILELALGYNGFGRLDGSETGSIGGGGGGGSAFGGATGVFRLFQSEFGGQISWLIPAALISLGALLWISRRAPRTSRVRAFALLWGGWLLVTGLVFSYMQGIIHPYYMVALAPAIGALVGVGAIALVQSGLSVLGRAVAAIGVLVTGIWAYELLNRTPEWLPWLRWTVLLAGVLGAVSVFAVPELLRWTERNRVTASNRRRAPALVYAPMAIAIVAGLGGPLAYSLNTANTTHTGSIPSAGPTVAGSFGGGGAPGGGGFGGGFGTHTGTGTGPTGTHSGTGTAPTGTGGSTGAGTGAGGTTGTTGAPTGAGGSTSGGFPGGSGSFPGGGTSSTGGSKSATGSGTAGSRPGGTGRGTSGTGGPGGGGAAMGGLSGSTQVSSALVTLLEQDASKYRWIAATVGTQEAAPIELATGGDAVLAIGGFNGTDPSPTLAEFEALVAKGEIHYYLGENTETFGGGTGSSAITSWVAAHFKSETVGGVTVYNLTQEK